MSASGRSSLQEIILFDHLLFQVQKSTQEADATMLSPLSSEEEEKEEILSY